MGARAPIGILLASLLVVPAADAMSRTVDPREIRQAILERWAAIAPTGATLEIRAVPSLPYDGGEAVIEVGLPDDPSRPGPRALAVSCRVGRRVVSRGLANVVLRVERTAWLARRRLARGEELHADDLLAETRVHDREPLRRFAWDPRFRWRLVRDVEPGTCITRAHVVRVPDVEAGQEILLVSRAGHSSVSVPARARRSGNVGDVILVHNPLTGALVRALVLDGNSAELVTPQAAGRKEERR